MNRRLFLRTGSLAGLTLTTAGLTALDNTKSLKDSATNQQGRFELEEITIDELQQKMKSGQTSSVTITQLYLNRIALIDKAGPTINAVIEINKDALAIAAAMDKERKAGKIRGPLHGIPVLIKDNINTGDKMMTTAGALAMTGNIAAKDAFIIEQLRAVEAPVAGAAGVAKPNALTLQTAILQVQVLARALLPQPAFVPLQ
jgi:amidase